MKIVYENTIFVKANLNSSSPAFTLGAISWQLSQWFQLTANEQWIQGKFSTNNMLYKAALLGNLFWSNYQPYSIRLIVVEPKIDE